MSRYTAHVDLHLILSDSEGRVLLGQRRNTGWADGHLGLPPGHLKDGESATTGMAREADDDVLVKADSLRLVHVDVRRPGQPARRDRALYRVRPVYSERGLS